MFNLVDFDTMLQFCNINKNLVIGKSREEIDAYFLYRSPWDIKDSRTHWQKIKWAPAGTCLSANKKIAQRCRSAPPRAAMLPRNAQLL